MDRVLNFGYLPPRAGLSSELPLSMLANKRSLTSGLGANGTQASKKTKSTKGPGTELEQRCVNYIRVLSAEMVQQANSGHPGAPMGCAPMAHVLWSRVMNYDPKDHKWPNRDRFVLSNGHGCALLYSMLHLTGYDISLADLQQFRQIGSKTPGHPENHVTPGVEVSTGPLGQGISNAVGLALAQAHMAATFNREGFPLIDNYTFVICGDGCLQEGISSEASSLAGHLRLGKLIVLYDDNKITIDGNTDLSFTEDVCKRYEAYGWQTLVVEDGDNAIEALHAAIESGKADNARPTLIKVATTIGFGSKKSGTHDVHGAPLGHADLANLKTSAGFNAEEFFVVPSDVSAFFAKCGKAGTTKAEGWRAMFAKYAKTYPDQAAEFERRRKGELPTGWRDMLPKWSPSDKGKATRQSSQDVLQKLTDTVPELVGGSADLTPSNLTKSKGATDFQAATPEGRYIRFGVREHAMAAVCNGIAAYGFLRPFCATFLNFVGYALGAVRVSALSELPTIYIATHDSIGLGEDGPTHQPVEAIVNLRATPNLLCLRPADANEVSGSYALALENRKRPSVICLSRQACPNLEGSSCEAVAKGAYALSRSKPDRKLQLVLAGSGSEVQFLTAALPALSDLAIQVVSVPSWELFDAQPLEYRLSVLPAGVPCLAMEAASVEGWSKYAHYVIGMRTFGVSGPGKAVQTHFGFTTENVVSKSRELLQFYETRPIPNLLDKFGDWARSG